MIHFYLPTRKRTDLILSSARGYWQSGCRSGIANVYARGVWPLRLLALLLLLSSQPILAQNRNPILETATGDNTARLVAINGGYAVVGVSGEGVGALSKKSFPTAGSAYVSPATTVAYSGFAVRPATANAQKASTTGIISSTSVSEAARSGVNSLAAPLLITTLSPTRNQLNAAVATQVSVTFDQLMSNGAATLGALHVFSQQRGGKLRNGQGGTTTASGNTLSLDPTINFRPGETIFATITSQAQSNSGASLANGQVYQFTTQVRGAGSGDFRAMPAISVGSTPQDIRAGDLNNDGNVDFVTVDYAGNTVSIRLGTGTGTFTTPAAGSQLTAPSSPLGVALGDIDNDGDLDILAAGSTTVNVYRNNGSASFGSPTSLPIGAFASSLSMGDVDSDGDLDFVVANTNANGTGSTASVRLNDGNGQFTAPADGGTVSLGSGPVWVALHDMDGDSDLDLLATNVYDNNLSVRLNNGSGQFASPASQAQVATESYPSVFAVGDIDGDGDLDVVVGNGGSNSASILKNNGSAQLTNVASVPLGNQSQSVALGDVDSDGDLDIVAANSISNTISVRFNDGLGNFTAPATNANPSIGGNFPVVVVLADVDNDDDLDALTNNFNSNDVSVLLNSLTNPIILAGTATGTATACVGTASSSQSFTVAGNNLTANLVVTAPAGFELSTNASTGFGPSLTLTQSSGVVSRTTLYVRTAATASAGNFLSRVSLTTSGANSQTVAVTATVGALPTVSITPSPSSTITSGGSVTLTAATASSFLWSDGSTTNPLVLTNVTSATVVSVTGTTNGCSATASVGISVSLNVTAPDLTPLFSLPDANFPNTPGASKNLVVKIQEVGGLPTSAGNITVVLTAPEGYTLAFDNTLNSIEVSGGLNNPVSVNNGDWEAGSVVKGQPLSLSIKAGTLIEAYGASVIGLRLVRTTANSGSVANITVNVVDDTGGGYDHNASNNIYVRILNGL